MRMSFTTQDPSEVRMTLTVTLSIREWERLLEQLEESWPASDLRREIRAMVRHASQHFTAKVGEEGGEG